MNQHTRTHAHVQRAAQITAGLLIAWSLAACGGSPEPTPTPTLAPTQPPLPTAAPPTQAPSPRIVPSPTPAEAAPAATAAPAANAAGCTNKAANVRDVTIPDGAVLQRGENFSKTWRIKNAGTCTWDASYTIAFNAGDRLDGKNGVTLPNTPPGADAEISVPMCASLRAGKFQGFWKLRAPNGQDFGTGPEGNVAFWVLITVK